MAAELYDIEIDWVEANEWVCPFCGGDIDHLHQEDYEDEGYNEDSYKCVAGTGWMCEHAYMMVRWSRTKRGSNGDALTLKHWIQVEVDRKYINKKEAKNE